MPPTMEWGCDRMTIKPGADVRFIRPEVAARLWTIEQIFKHHAPEGYEFVITSGTEGRHSVNSLHYKGLAIDVRRWWREPGLVETHDLGVDTLSKIRRDLVQALGRDWDIVIERTHVHIELDMPRVTD